MDERKAFEPGSYQDVDNEVYQMAPGISKSKLSKMDCPLKSRGLPKPPTDAMFVGTIVHLAILEPDRFEKDVAAPFQLPADQVVLTTSDDIKSELKRHDLKVTGTKPELIARLKEVDPSVLILDELKASYEQANAGLIIVKPEVYDKARYMRDSVWAHPEASRLLAKKGTFEESHFWIDDRTGELCKCRTDRLDEDRTIVDLKKVANAAPYAFRKAIFDYKYHWQDAWYRRGLQANDFIFMCVEDDEINLGEKKVYAVELYDLTSRARRQGEQEIDEALDRYLTCKALDLWPTYNDNDRVNKLDLPAWAQKGETWDAPDVF